MNVPIDVSLVCTDGITRSLRDLRGHRSILLIETLQSVQTNQHWHARLRELAADHPDTLRTIALVPILLLGLTSARGIMYSLMLATAKQVASQHGIVVWIDPTSAFPKRLGLDATRSHLLVLNEQGHWMWGWSGALTEDALRELVSRLTA